MLSSIISRAMSWTPRPWWIIVTPVLLSPLLELWNGVLPLTLNDRPASHRQWAGCPSSMPTAPCLTSPLRSGPSKQNEQAEPRSDMYCRRFFVPAARTARQECACKNNKNCLDVYRRNLFLLGLSYTNTHICTHEAIYQSAIPDVPPLTNRLPPPPLFWYMALCVRTRAAAVLMAALC